MQAQPERGGQPAQAGGAFDGQIGTGGPEDGDPVPT